MEDLAEVRVEQEGFARARRHEEGCAAKLVERKVRELAADCAALPASLGHISDLLAEQDALRIEREAERKEAPSVRGPGHDEGAPDRGPVRPDDPPPDGRVLRGSERIPPDQARHADGKQVAEHTHRRHEVTERPPLELLLAIGLIASSVVIGVALLITAEKAGFTPVAEQAVGHP